MSTYRQIGNEVISPNVAYWFKKPDGQQAVGDLSMYSRARPLAEHRLARLILFGEGSLRNAVCEYLEHYHGERNHQGLGNQLLEPAANVGRVAGKLQQRERLGGMLRYYYRDAA